MGISPACISGPPRAWAGLSVGQCAAVWVPGWESEEKGPPLPETWEVWDRPRVDGIYFASLSDQEIQ